MIAGVFVQLHHNFVADVGTRAEAQQTSRERFQPHNSSSTASWEFKCMEMAFDLQGTERQEYGLAGFRRCAQTTNPPAQSARGAAAVPKPATARKSTDRPPHLEPLPARHSVAKCTKQQCRMATVVSYPGPIPFGFFAHIVHNVTSRFRFGALPRQLP